MDRIDDAANRDPLSETTARDARDIPPDRRGEPEVADALRAEAARDKGVDPDADPEYEEEAIEARERIVNPEYAGEETVADEIRDDTGPGLDVTDDDRDGTNAEAVGEGVGGVSGAVAGAAIGSLAGPLGTVIGGIAGAVGGWWAGRAIVDASTVAVDEDHEYREHYEGSEHRIADRSYDDVRPAYHLGHLAAANPDYVSRGFDEVEPELRAGWSDDVRARYCDWEHARHFARESFTRRRTRLERDVRLGGTPRSMTPTEAALDRLHEDATEM